MTHSRPPAWVEIETARLRNNFALINAERPPGVELLSVVKDNGYGHGAAVVAEAAVAAGASHLGVVTVAEGLELRGAGIDVPILCFGERQESELAECVASSITCVVSAIETVQRLGKLAEEARRRVPVHLKINTGMNRWGVRWTDAPRVAAAVHAERWLDLAGLMSHFAMSDETDKTFAMTQLERFRATAERIGQTDRRPLRHISNSGGFLDLPMAHLDMVRLGILPLGVYPSLSCRRLPGVLPVMSVKTRIATIQTLEPGESAGYGMRFVAPTHRRVAVLPVGYGDGYPRPLEPGWVLVRGRRIPVVAGPSMDAFMVDVTEVAGASLWDEVVLIGTQGTEEITVRDVATWSGRNVYEILVGWRSRLPRVNVG